jgi:hypothetical protein
LSSRGEPIALLDNSGGYADWYSGAASGALSAIVPKSYGTLAGAVVTHFSSGVSNIATMISSTVYSVQNCNSFEGFGQNSSYNNSEGFSLVATPRKKAIAMQATASIVVGSIST